MEFIPLKYGHWTKPFEEPRRSWNRKKIEKSIILVSYKFSLV